MTDAELLAENPHSVDYNGIPDEVERRLHAAWQSGHDSRDAEVAALRVEVAALRTEVDLDIDGKIALHQILLALQAEVAALKAGRAELCEEVRQLMTERDNTKSVELRRLLGADWEFRADASTWMEALCLVAKKAMEETA